MFRFCWNTESRTPKDTKAAVVTEVTPQQISESQTHPRKRFSGDADESPAPLPSVKRARHGGGAFDANDVADGRAYPTWNSRTDAQALRDNIEHILGTEILSKHNEKRLIDQELAKCQIALEQLRRCHLIPYPVKSTSLQQRIDVSNGCGTAIQTKPGDPTSRWAPPFGVVDGPYARHYARWLLPHPDFDASDDNWQYVRESRYAAPALEGRTTRNSAGDITVPSRGRVARGAESVTMAQAPLSVRGEPKKKPGPCIIKRSDGLWVKLVCLTCNREDFSSTQGFINHCRIAHKNELKSHEEAAVKCGQPVESNETKGNAAGGDDQVPQSTWSMNVHPFARPDMTEQEAYVALRSRIAASMELVRQGKLSEVQVHSRNAGVHAQATAQDSFDPVSAGAPHLSRLLQSRDFDGDLDGLLKDVTSSIPMGDENLDEESDDETPVSDAPLPRLPVVKRVPARSDQSPAPHTRPGSHKGFDMTVQKELNAAQGPDDDPVMDEPTLSPNAVLTMSNNAPSLVSDDGEYDSDEGSSVSNESDGNLDADSVSDVAEINLEDEHDPRVLRRTSTGLPSTVRLRNDDSKAVTFVSTIGDNRKERRRRAA